MKAMVFAAGIGSRLKPFTNEHPKALVEVGGKPMLQRVIEKLKDNGVGDFTVNVHHFANQIVEFLKANDNFGAKISISDESDKLLDTGGGIVAAFDLLKGDGPIIMHNADILTDAPMAEMLKVHETSCNDVTLLVAPRKTSRYLLFDSSMRMCGWTNVSTGKCLPDSISDISAYQQLAFGGVHIISQRALSVIREYAAAQGLLGEPFSITNFYIAKCQDLKIGAFMQPSGRVWFDVGRPETLDAARQYIGE
jgi:NDP-sugar pyrophosphorylase family protein